MFRVANPAMPVTLRRFALVALACSAVMLQGCGGGNRAKAYQPGALVAFGDENSMYAPDYTSATLNPAGSTAKSIQGLIYTVNPTVVGVVVDSATATFATGGAYYCTDATPTTLCATSALLTNVSTFDSTNASAHSYKFDSINSGEVSNTVTTISLSSGTSTSDAPLPGLKQTVDTVYQCDASSLWIQAIAHNFGFGFNDKCPRDRAGAKTYAEYEATVAMVAAQVANHRAELGSGVLVTMMAGQKDIMTAYTAYKTAVANGTAPETAQANAIASLQGAAVVLSDAVQNALGTGAKVVLSLVPDLGESPLVLSAATAASENQAVLKALTKAFNDKVFSVLAQNAPDGRKLAFVEPVLFTNPSTRSSSYVYGEALCDMANIKRPDGITVASGDGDYAQRLKFCTSKSFVTSGSTATYMWADSTHFAPLGHLLIGSAGATRAANQF
jgi:hypothetical protein